MQGMEKYCCQKSTSLISFSLFQLLAVLPPSPALLHTLTFSKELTQIWVIVAVTCLKELQFPKTLSLQQLQRRRAFDILLISKNIIETYSYHKSENQFSYLVVTLLLQP
jgi:hypothetical protein